MRDTLHKCPVCAGPMNATDGDTLHPLDPKFGVFVYCPNWQCPAQECMGHGKSEKEAFEIVTQKYKLSK